MPSPASGSRRRRRGSRDDSDAGSIADEGHVPRVVRYPDDLPVHALAHADGVPQSALPRRHGDGSADAAEVVAAVLGDDDSVGTIRRSGVLLQRRLNPRGRRHRRSTVRLSIVEHVEHYVRKAQKRHIHHRLGIKTRLKYHIRDACQLDKSLICWKQMAVDMTRL